MGNIVTGDDNQTQLVINCSVLPCLLALLDSDRKGIRKETCWTISNITAGSKDQLQAVIDHRIIPKMIHMLDHEDFDIRKECAWAISNATSGGDDMQIKYLVDSGAVPPLVNLLDKPDVRIVSVALEGIENILKCGQRNLQPDGTNPFVPVVEVCGQSCHSPDSSSPFPSPCTSQYPFLFPPPLYPLSLSPPSPLPLLPPSHTLLAW